MTLGDLLKEEQVFNLNIESETYLPVLWGMYNSYLESLLTEYGFENERFQLASGFYNYFVDNHNEQDKPEVLNLPLTMKQQVESCVVLLTFAESTKRVVEIALSEEEYGIVAKLNGIIDCAEKMLDKFKYRGETEINIKAI